MGLFGFQGLDGGLGVGLSWGNNGVFVQDEWEKFVSKGEVMYGCCSKTMGRKDLDFADEDPSRIRVELPHGKQERDSIRSRNEKYSAVVHSNLLYDRICIIDGSCDRKDTDVKNDDDDDNYKSMPIC